MTPPLKEQSHGGPALKKKHLIAAVSISAAFPFVVVLLLYPLDVYIHNTADLGGDPTLLYPFFLATGAAVVCSLLLGIVLVHRTPPAVGSAVSAIGLWLGSAFVFNDLVAPVRLTNSIGFDGKESIVPASLALALSTAAALLIGLIIAWKRRHREVIRVGPAVAGIFVLITAGPGFYKFSNQTRQIRQSPASSKWISIPPPSPDKVDHPNVYHILLDGFRGSMFRDALVEAGLSDRAFDGFTYFPKNRSNYDGTQTSTPSFLTGTLYRGGSFKKWMESWADTGIFPEVKTQLGTDIQAYSYGAYHELTQWVRGRKIERANSTHRMQNLILHLSLARAAPPYGRERIYRNGFGILSPWILSDHDGADPRLEPMHTLIADERQRPGSGQYVFSHIYFPHGPFLVDQYGVRSGRASLLTQSACALRLVADFIQELKQSGRYQGSIIIIHSDHGWGDEVPANETDRVPEKIQVEYWKRSEQELDRWTSALLLIKPAGSAGAPMVVSERTTQLLDLPNTLYSLLHMPETAPEGKSVMASDYPENPERHIFTGFRQWSLDQHRQLWLGKDFLKGEFNHFTWSGRSGLKILPSVPVTWESTTPTEDKLVGTATLLGGRRIQPNVIELSWPATARRGDYEIEMATGTGDFDTIGRGSAAPGHYVVADVATDVTYRFRGRLIVNHQIHAWSATVTIPPAETPGDNRVSATAVPPVRPKLDLTEATPLSGHRRASTQIELNWPADTPSGIYEIEMAADDGAFTPLGRGAAESGRYEIGDIAPDSAYRFRARWTNQQLSRAWSAIVIVAADPDAKPKVDLRPGPTEPAKVASNQPITLSARRLEPTVIELTWPPDAVDGTYDLEMAVDGSDFTPLGRGAIQPGRYVVGDIAAGTAYRFRARRSDHEQPQAWSETVTVPSRQ